MKPLMFEQRKSFPCGDREDFRTCAGNGDANCHRLRPTYSMKLIKKDPTLCDTCVYKIETMIPIKKEPKELYKEFRCYEKCKFCRKETDTWHKKTNTPVCNICAKSHTVADL